MPYIDLAGCWCNVIVLNVPAPSEEKSDESKDNFCGQLEQAFDHISKCDTKILLGDFNAKLWRQDISDRRL
jgi:exonuclease III